MDLSHITIEALKAILEQLPTPEALDSHPWATAMFVQEAVANQPALAEAAPGRRLAFALEALFAASMPSLPPRRGKRLDNHWGEFGLLAAQYFAPLRFGAPRPASLREAWGRIDRSILLYVFGPEPDALPPEQVAAYKLVADEPEVAPTSTLSDWHRKGLEKLTAVVRAREQYLLDHPQPETPRQAIPRRSFPRRAGLVLLFLLIGLLAAALLGGLKAKRMWDQAQLIWEEAAQLRSLASSPSMESVRSAGPALTNLRQHYLALKVEAEPFLWLGPWLDWVPVHGGDLASLQDLVTYSDSLLAALDTSYQALLPLATRLDETGFDPSQFTDLLVQAAPQLTAARTQLDQALQARARLDMERLSPQVRSLVAGLDPYLPLMQDGLLAASEFPRLVGATSEGPKTYLLLVQNADELRPTGGFLTAAGTLLVQEGRIVSLNFEDSGSMDDWAKPYPVAPWQLQQYMNSPVLVLRDANWFTDFPTSALYAEYLYSYRNAHSVDGVIAFDQQALVTLLRAIGPIDVPGADQPVDANNVIEFMRASKAPTAEDLATPGWSNKAFINDITRAMLDRLFAGDLEWEALSRTLLQILNEHHLLLQVDNPAITALLVRHGWDGAVRPGAGDFLMVVDSNVGFNKTNAVVETRLSYETDLTDLAAPGARLSVLHTNHASANIPCTPYSFLNPDELGQYYEHTYPIDRCYWDYLRVYTRPGTELLQANPQSIPAEWMVRREPVPPQVDVLEEEISGVQGFGALKVVPGGQTVETNFRLRLPGNIVVPAEEPGWWVYRLRVQKQPGTVAVPLSIRLVLPEGAVVSSLPAGMTAQANVLLLETTLRQDVELELRFRLP